MFRQTSRTCSNTSIQSTYHCFPLYVTGFSNSRTECVILCYTSGRFVRMLSASTGAQIGPPRTGCSCICSHTPLLHSPVGSVHSEAGGNLLLTVAATPISRPDGCGMQCRGYRGITALQRGWSRLSRPRVQYASHTVIEEASNTSVACGDSTVSRTLQPT